MDDPIVHQAAPISCDLASAIAYTKQSYSSKLIHHMQDVIFIGMCLGIELLSPSRAGTFGVVLRVERCCSRFVLASSIFIVGDQLGVSAFLLGEPSERD
jgi:hypothetical protein